MVRSTLNRAEAKYNVTTEFPSLGLHYAAASGDLGLVEYALNHGQPVNSVVDGVLPLHAACAGGSSLVVKLLIDHGADVNAQRLPRKYSSERNRVASVPIIGETGSTPLHFAAANGNTEVVNLLLLHGARADRADKHGITPEMVAEENGWVECSTILRQWTVNKDRDLRERENSLPYDARSDISASPPSFRSRRLHVKRSMDTALAMLKTADPPWKSRETLVKSSQGFLPSSSPSSIPIDPNARRPSLPQINHPSIDPYRKRQSPSPGPRPRSAGTDSEKDDRSSVVYGRGGAGRRHHASKYSFMTIFKKSAAEEGLDPTLAADGQSSRGSPIPASAPITGSFSTLPPQIRSGYSPSFSSQDLPEPPTHPLSALHPSFSHEPADPSIRSGRLTPHSPPKALLNLPQIESRPLGVEVQLALSEQSQIKNLDLRSLPSGQVSLDDQSQVTVIPPSDSEKKVQPSPNSRPGILRAHNRTASSSQGSPLPRMLRFDSTSSGDRKARDSPRGTPAPPDGSSSMAKTRFQVKNDTTGSQAQDLPIDDGKSGETGDQEENYGQLLTSSSLKLNMTSMLLQRPRALSFGSPSDTELSPIDSVNDSSIAALKSEFPFNMDDRRPNHHSDDDVDGSLSDPRYLSVPAATTPDKRGRGDSLSSNSTSSENRSNSHTSSSARGHLSTPGLLSVLASPLLSDQSLVKEFDLSPPADDLLPAPVTTSSSQSTTRSRIPMDIDLSVISSHADAEALVEQTRQDALELAGNQEISFISMGSGHTPLSARLAAYGTSLALEKKLRKEKEASERSFSVLEATAELPSFLPSPLSSPQRSRDVMERQHSLRERRTPAHHRRPRNDPRRPATADGVTSTKQDIFVRESPSSARSAPGIQMLDGVKRDPLFASASSPGRVASEKPAPSEITRLPPSGVVYAPGYRYPLEEPSIRRLDGADTTESDTIEQFIAIPVSDPKKSVMKLTRMGYPEAAIVNRSTPPPAPLNSTRFGALKTFMQTLRSKT